VFVWLNVFNISSEYFFWEEFGVRYNFIAVDYLVYTTEVIANIREAYPIYRIIIIVTVIALTLTVLTQNFFYKLLQTPPTSLKKRIFLSLLFLCVPVFLFLFIDNAVPNISGNAYENNLAANGIYCLFSSFRNNTLEYNDFYYTEDNTKVFSYIKKLFHLSNPSNSNKNYSIAREIKHNAPEKRYNIILTVIESMSAEFMSEFGGKKNVTPNLDLLAANGKIYTNLYATGTRTVRGLESISLSIPPLPGQSIIKRPKNENIDFCISKVFIQKGYDLKFIYGGFGYFDNMNYFFSHNGFETVDRSDMSSDEITFSNAWGVCDEDLFNKTIIEANKSDLLSSPFFYLLMTASNHRPYTYPENKIDIKSGLNREGAVKYCDYAIGEFIKKAKKQKWFSNTIFVFTADHCASSAGKSKLSVEKYKIPLIIYAPDIIKPSVNNALASQIDVVPTIFELMNWSYESKFFGEPISEFPTDYNRAFISNYQKLGYFKNDNLVVLEPKRQIYTYEFFADNNCLIEIKDNNNLTFEAVSYYQSASYLYKKISNKTKPLY